MELLIVLFVIGVGLLIAVVAGVVTARLFIGATETPHAELPGSEPRRPGP